MSTVEQWHSTLSMARFNASVPQFHSMIQCAEVIQEEKDKEAAWLFHMCHVTLLHIMGAF